MSEWGHLYNCSKWKRLRKSFLFSCPRCVMCVALRRQTPAKEVDHIIPHCGDAELFWDEGNWQGLCKSCHSSKTFYETIKTTRLPKNIKPASSDVTLLFGPPCSGKTTHANKSTAKVIDLDDIKRTISGQNPYEMDTKYLSMCIAVRNRMIRETKGPVLIVASLPDPAVREDWIKKLSAKPVLMITPMYLCIKRVKESDRPNIAGQVALIKRWFEKFKPLGNEDFAQ